MRGAGHHGPPAPQLLLKERGHSSAWAGSTPCLASSGGSQLTALDPVQSPQFKAFRTGLTPGPDLLQTCRVRQELFQQPCGREVQTMDWPPNTMHDP